MLPPSVREMVWPSSTPLVVMVTVPLLSSSVALRLAPQPAVIAVMLGPVVSTVTVSAALRVPALPAASTQA